MNQPQTEERTRHFMQPVYVSNRTWATLKYRAEMAECSIAEYVAMLIEEDQKEEEE